MHIRSVTLENIRSYISETIRFPEGSVMLSGDIGSGKSTILSAIEFALFGIKRPELSGASLLRHGKRQGSVEVNFTIDGKEVILKRTLKSSKEEVKQEAGYIIIDGMKREGTPVELKAWVLDILGYPKELLTKSKDLVYRYTIYTPQEQMKQILLEEGETRLDLLRRVFGIDKYKRIRENAAITEKAVKDKRKLLEASIGDIDHKQQQLAGYRAQAQKLSDDIDSSARQHQQVVEQLSAAKAEVESHEQLKETAILLRRELSMATVLVQAKEHQLQRIAHEQPGVAASIVSLHAEIGSGPVLTPATLAEQISKRTTQIVTCETKIRDCIKRISQHESHITHSQSITKKISDLDHCPLCLQAVSASHKQQITLTEAETIAASQKELAILRSDQQSAENEMRLLKEGLATMQKKQAESSLLDLKRKQLQEKQTRAESLAVELSNASTELAAAKTHVISITTQLQPIEIRLSSAQASIQQYELLRSRERDIAIALNVQKKQAETLQQVISELTDEIAKKALAKSIIHSLKEKETWIGEHFIPLMATIEKHVMATIHHEFDTLFREWFRVMIEDEVLQARLDDSFSPLIEQDGYECSYEQLSGGERTSLALAYRLALTKVINDLISTLRTKDIIILDEPTDGFSSEQLDKVRDVLQQLHLTQILIVSHEPKMEGFVDHVIRISKEGHVSRVE